MDKGNFALYRGRWHLYGKLRTDKAIMVRYWDSWENLDLAFFVVRDTEKVIRFNKHLKLHRELWADAVAEYKKERPGHDVSEGAIYEIIIRKVNEV